jgi:predicted RND superfamily exporter protein
MFKSVLVGLIGSIPVILTSLISFALMGFANIPLGGTTALVASIAMGIGVDFAIQFIQRYKVNSLDGVDRVQVAILTMSHTGRAIFYNALIVTTGFIVLLFSAFPPNRELGALISLNMFFCFFGTLVIMLIVINLIKPHLISKKEEVNPHHQ